MKLVAAALVALLAGCTPVYSAQYDDRQQQLEQNRDEFLPASANVSAIATGGKRIYWVDDTQAEEQNVLHSVGSGLAQVDYDVPVSSPPFSEFALGDTLFANCASGRVFSAASPANTEIGEFPSADEEDPCAMYGSTVYYIDESQQADQWSTSDGSNIHEVFSPSEIGIPSGGVNAFGPIDSNRYLFMEGVNVWLVTGTGAAATKLVLNDGTNVSSGIAVFDSEGVVFPVAGEGSAGYVRYDAPGDVKSINAMIADGGYELNFENKDIQDLVENATYYLYEQYLIYQAQGGVFALDLETGYVTDVLLDGRRDESTDEQAPFYGPPTITSDGQLYIQDNSFVSETKAVYHVDLNVVLAAPE